MPTDSAAAVPSSVLPSSAVPSSALAPPPRRERPASFLATGADATLVEQIVAWHAARIDERVLRPGMRLASIRRFAAEHGVSRFTVVEAYDRLIARGYVESRRGSGFFVRDRAGDPLAGGPGGVRPAAGFGAAGAGPGAAGDGPGSAGDGRVGRIGARAAAPRPIDVVWLLRNMFRDLPAGDMPGAGTLPPDWLDGELVGASLRAVARGNGAAWLDYGHPQGWLPLRQQLQVKLAEIGIGAPPAQLLTTSGVTQALDLVAQHFLRPGDAVLVDEPSWFLMFGRFALLGARVIGVPREADGPDLARLRALAAEHRPKLYVLGSVLHNPSSTCLSPAKAFQVLRLAEEFGFRPVEDDIYADLHPGPGDTPAVRLAALDQLARVIYLGGFSKTLAANLRVGFIACDEPLARALTDLKMLVGLTTPEIGERVVYKVLGEGHYRRHAQRLRARLSEAREPALRALESLGLAPFATPASGMFAWVDAGVDTAGIARELHEQGFLLAPGSLFLPDQRPSTFMRFNLATTRNPRMLQALARALDRAR